jgi:hypothetical protein
MAKQNQGGAPPKQPFVSKEDRPEVKINLDTPLSQLRVRELSSILGLMVGKSPFEAGKTSLKDFFDKDFPEVAKDWLKEIKPENLEKPPKLEKAEKFEKNEKLEKFEKDKDKDKNEKVEKPEKSEHKEIKAEKQEVDGVVLDPVKSVGPDPRMDQVIQAVMGLTRQVSQLADQVEELRKKVSK